MNQLHLTKSFHEAAQSIASKSKRKSFNKFYFVVAIILFLFSRVNAQTLAIPAVATGQSNNYFIAGTGDGGTLSTYNSFLRLHWGLAIGSPFTDNGSGGYIEKATISFDARSGHISTLGYLGIGKSTPASFNLDISTTGDYQGIQLYHSSGRWSRIYSSMPVYSFNGITAQNDSGIIFGKLGGIVDNGFVIAPHRDLTSGLRIDQTGNVGIGNSTPNASLDIKYRDGSTNLYRASDQSGQFRWRIDQMFDMYLTNTTGADIVKIGQNGVWFNSGNVGIGTTTTDAKLTVKGDIHANEVRVDLNGAVAPDYVFEKDYDLLSLTELETYINQNKHLPEVPSAKEMEANGLNLKEMNLLLLKKVEELSLHLIEQNKVNDGQETTIKTLIKRIDQLENK